MSETFRVGDQVRLIGTEDTGVITEVVAESQWPYEVQFDQGDCHSGVFAADALVNLTKPAHERIAELERERADLLEALREGLDIGCDCADFGLDASSCWHVRARAAIAKAEGSR